MMFSNESKQPLLAVVLMIVTFIAGGCVSGEGAKECGPGAVLEDGACVVDTSGCAAGTVLDGSTCVASSTSCEAGTSFDRVRGKCVADTEVVCGRGTEANADDVCVPSAEICGEKTRLDGGRCVIEAAACGRGTQLDPNTGACELAAASCGPGLAYDASGGQCVPTDAICDDGTRFDESSGLCLPDSCREGDAIIDGVCTSPVAQKAQNADLQESENNDPSLGGNAEPFVFGAPGDAPFVIAGTIGAPVDLNGDGRLDQDVDAYTFEASAGEWIDITVESNGLPSPAFRVEAESGVDIADDFTRSSAIGSGRDASRQVVIPADGTYTLTVLPSLVLASMEGDRGDGVIRGEDGFGYVASLERLGWPQAPARDVSAGTTSFSGRFDRLGDNAFEIAGATPQDIVTLRAQSLGADADGVIQVWSDTTTPDATTLHHLQPLVAGTPVVFGMPASTATVLVGWARASGPMRDFEVTAAVTGRQKATTLTAGASMTLTVNARRLDRIQIGQANASGAELDVIVTDSTGTTVGDETLASDAQYSHLAAIEGDFTVEFINNSATSVDADVWVNVVEPLDLGVAAANSTTNTPEVSVRPQGSVHYTFSTQSGSTTGQVITFEHDNLQGQPVKLRVYDDAGTELVAGEEVSPRSSTQDFDADDILWAYLPADTSVRVELEAIDEVSEQVAEVRTITVAAEGILSPGAQLTFPTAGPLRAHQSGFHLVDAAGPTGFFGALTPSAFEDVDFFVHDLQGTEISRNEGTSGEVILGGGFDAAGTYLVRVECDEVCSGYDVQLEGTINDQDLGTIGTGASQDSQTVSTFGSGQSLTLRFDVPAGHLVEISHENTGGQNHQLFLYDANGTLLASDARLDVASDSFPDYLYWYSETAGSFEAVFEPTYASTNEVASVRAFEPVDLPSIAVGGSISRTGIGPLPRGPIDMYLVELEADAGLVVTPTVPNGEDVDVFLYDLAMTEIDSATSGGPDTLGPTQVGAGTFLIGIQGYEPVASYDLDVALQ
jgi:hypothetical protein